MNPIEHEAVTAKSEHEYIITFAFNNTMPYGYNIAFTPGDEEKSQAFIRQINNECVQFLNHYDKKKSAADFINELRHVASCCGTKLNLRLADELKLNDEQYNNDVIMFCMAIFFLWQSGVLVDTQLDSGLELSKSLMPFYGDNQKEFVQLQHIKDYFTKEAA